MTTPTPAEQIRRFIERHPGEWQSGDWRADGGSGIQAAAVLAIGGGSEIALVANGGERVAVWALRSGGHHVGFVGHHVRLDGPLLTRIASRVADCLQLRGGSADTLPPWLADPVRHILRTRAGELLTLAGSSPADVVSAAETVDEALCARPVVEVTGILPTLMSLGMSCRWVADPVKRAAPKPDAAFSHALLDAIKRADHLAYGGSLTADLVQEPAERARILAEVEAWRSVAAALRGMP